MLYGCSIISGPIQFFFDFVFLIFRTKLAFRTGYLRYDAKLIQILIL